MEQSTYLVQRPQMSAVLTFVPSAYLGGASRERWLIRLTSSLNDSACGFVFPPYDWSVGRCHGWTVEIGEGHRTQTGPPVQSSKLAGETGRDSELDACSARVRREQKAASKGARFGAYFTQLHTLFVSTFTAEPHGRR
jgi:hypothetical protein